MNKNKRTIVIAIMIVMFLVAFEGTVVTTAMPTIAKDLQGYNLISLVFAAYLLTSAVSTPIYGKFSDLYGRKKTLSIGIIIFLIGSSLCGLSQTMIQLIIFRALQGIGAGSIFTVTYTIVGDIFELSEKAKVQGFLSTVWGIATLLGPFLGGFLIDYLSWHWIFFINIPFGLLSIFMLKKNLEEVIVPNNAKTDYLGALFLTIAIVSILLTAFSNSINYKIIFLILAIISIIIFYFVEKKSDEPIVPFDIFTRNIVLVNLICFFIAGLLMGIEAYTPIFTQNILGYNPTISGLTMAPMSISWILSSFILSKALPKYGAKNIIQLSLLILILSSVCLSFLKVNTSIIFLIIPLIFMGFSFGGIFTTSTIAVQDDVSADRIGVSTSTNTLIRTLGQTIVVSIFGGISTSSVTNYFNAIGMNGITSENVYSSKATTIQIQNAFYNGIHNIYSILFIIAIACLIISLGIKNTQLKK
ncbi:MDR family MFS transporter [Clostridium uliginosum]|uniref:Drug resistance transporter, EmrB/QacA subfamily n=1 Tax=Clostridium uliginosum TaxID=119641 RepID=A0A1I1LUB7_9CLOT|nr:MDR family MFS transporter [Clostridium uliginosum]SFC76857.1 drug resistance transporter, EmrB/QacA subfamily [Clostridium uliginosum]